MARIRRVRLEYRDSQTWLLLHDNAPSHNAIIVRQFLAQNKVCGAQSSTLLARFSTVRFLSIPKVEDEDKRAVF